MEQEADDMEQQQPLPATLTTSGSNLPEAVEPKSKRKMKTASQLELLEKTYAVETYPNETLRAELSAKLGLSDRQLQMWFCHRRLKDRKGPPTKRSRKDSPAAMVVAAPSVTPSVSREEDLRVGGKESLMGSSSPYGHNHHVRVPSVPVKRYYEAPTQSMIELRAISFVEKQLGEPLREDGPILGMEFDPLPPDAFGAPLGTVGLQRQSARPYEMKIYEGSDPKSSKSGVRHLHEYQFLPEQPTVRTETFERRAPSHFYGSSAEAPSSRASPLSSGRMFTHGNEVAVGYNFQNAVSSPIFLPQRQGHSGASASGDYESLSRKSSFPAPSGDVQYGAHPITALENPFVSSDRNVIHDDADDVTRMERKRKSDEARMAREVEAHEKRIRKELEKQDILRRKREEQMRKEMERHDRERRKEEERLLREKQREEERFQREQRRELERREKFMQKESIRAEKMRQKEELRREKEAARLKAANDRAIARRIAKESTELIEDERLELMELAVSSKGLPSMLSLDYETLQSLDSYRDMLITFPPKSAQLKRPFAIRPWADSEENVGNLLMVWKFLITFADVLGLWPFTLDEFVQAIHDYESRLLGEIHVALLRSIIKDIEDVARTPSIGLGNNQYTAVNPGGGHPQIVEGAYSWGFDIRSWQHNINSLTWPEILRQFALSAGYGPPLKKKTVEPAYPHDDNEANDCEDIILNLRNGIAAENAVAIMHERGYANPRKSRHRLTPGTVKFAAYHVLALEGSRGLTILEVADRIQKSGLRDLTTSKTPEASIAAALSRDTILFERTAPSTYCVRPAFRKDPADAEGILSAAREKILIFKSGFPDVEEAEEERQEDSGSEVAEDPEVDDLSNERNLVNKDLQQMSESKGLHANTAPGIGKDTITDEDLETPLLGLDKSADRSSLYGGSLNQGKNAMSIDHPISLSVGKCKEELVMNQDYTDIDYCHSGEPWVQGLMEGEYSDLSVEERLNALVALVGVATEGNLIRVVLEERLEAANALKKQMWAEVQIDKRKLKDEFVVKVQYPSHIGNKAESVSIADGKQSPFVAAGADKDNELPENTAVQHERLSDAQDDNGYINDFASERNLAMQDLSMIPDNLSLQQHGHALERSRSQFKSYIGHRAEETYVYRSLPLGQDRRRNRYWQFITSSSPNDPGCGRIIVELREGFWRLIDSEEGFDALVASLDVRGTREAHLHSMLQKIETSFKETVRRNSLQIGSIKQSVDQVKKEAEESNEYPGYGVADASRISSVCMSSSDSEPSSSFKIEFGMNEVERINSLKRNQDLQKWMWKEFFGSPFRGMKHGKKRCTPMISICEHCYDSLYFEGNHCSSCHNNYDVSVVSVNFSQHLEQCERRQKIDLNWNPSSSDILPIRIRMLKALIGLLEVYIPPEALQPPWTEDYRKAWGWKLSNSSVAGELLQALTMLENVIKGDYFSSHFETTHELLSKSNQLESHINTLSMNDSVCVLPWIPPTTAAVALRLMELDSSICYTEEQKHESLKEKEAGDFMTPSTKSTAVKNIKEDLSQDVTPYLQNDMLDLGSGHGGSGRGRGGRGRNVRGRSRGGRTQRRVSGARSAESSKSILASTNENFGQAVGWKGKSQGRGGRRRGRRTARNRQKPAKRIVKFVTKQDKQAPVDTYKNTTVIEAEVPDYTFEKTSGSFSKEEWNADEIARMRADDAENGSSSSASSDEEDEEEDQGVAEEYNARGVHSYAGSYNDGSADFNRDSEGDVDGDEDDEIDGVEEEEIDDDDDGEEEEVEGDEDEQADLDVRGYINGYSEEEGNGSEDRGRGQNAMLDDATESSSEFSD